MESVAGCRLLCRWLVDFFTLSGGCGWDGDQGQDPSFCLFIVHK